MASKARQAANAARSLRADSNGRLGIGVTAPDGDLHVKQTGEFSTTTNHGAIFIESTDSSENGGYGGAINFTRLDGSTQRRKAAIATKQFGGDGEDVGLAFFTADGDLSTNSNVGEALVIDGRGNVGVNSSTPDVYSLGSNFTVMRIHDTSGGVLNLTGNSSGYLQFGDGSVRKASVHSDTNSDLIFTLNASGSGTTLTERMRILNEGNVGIGTSSPAQRLHVGGGHVIVDNNQDFRTFDTSNTQRTLARINSSNEAEFGSSLSGPVKFMGGGSWTERIRIHTNGNVGIGTTSPGSTLDVDGNTRLRGAAFVGSATSVINGEKLRVADTGTFVASFERTDGTPHLLFKGTGGVSGHTGRFYMDNGAMQLSQGNASGAFSGNIWLHGNSSGNVGIGTSSPGAKLAVSGDIRADITSGTSLVLNGAGTNLQVQHSSGWTDFYNSGGGFKFSTASADDAVTINTNGNVGIGTTSPSLPLHVKGSNQPMLIEGTSAGAWIDYDGATGTHKFSAGRANGDQWSVYNRTDSTYLLNIMHDGKVGIGTTSPSQLLHVNGETRSTTMILGDSAAGNVATNSQLHIKTGGTPAIMLEDSTGSNLNMSLNVAEGTGFWIQDRGTSPSNTGTGRFNIDTSGRVGINCGTTVGANHAALTVKSVGTGVASSHGICVRNRTGLTDGARTYYNVYHTNNQTGGNTYHHIKTSIATGGYIMYRIDVRGYNYGTGANLDMSSVGYAYTSNSLISTNNYTHSGTGSIASYIASDGKVCFRINVGSSGYYAGFHIDAMFLNGTGYSHDFEVLGGTWTSSSSNQY